MYLYLAQQLKKWKKKKHEGRNWVWYMPVIPIWGYQDGGL
jgi:hypothetical protein